MPERIETAKSAGRGSNLGRRSRCGVTLECAGNGRAQPLEAVWNLARYANNAVQRVRVVAKSALSLTGPS